MLLPWGIDAVKRTLAANTISYIWSKLRTVVEQLLVSITSRHATSPCHLSAQPSRRLDVKLNLQVMALLRKTQTAPSPQHTEMGRSISSCQSATAIQAFGSNIEYPALVPRSYSDNLHHLNATTTNTINHSYTVNAKFQLPASRKPPQKRLTYLIRPKRQASDTLVHHDSHRTIKR